MLYLTKYLLTRKYFTKSSRRTWWQTLKKDSDISLDFLKTLSNPDEFSRTNVELILSAFEYGLSTKQVEILANPKFNKAQIRAVRDGFLMGIGIRRMREIIKDFLLKYNLLDPFTIVSMAAQNVPKHRIIAECARQQCIRNRFY